MSRGCRMHDKNTRLQHTSTVCVRLFVLGVIARHLTRQFDGDNLQRCMTTRVRLTC